MGKKLLADLPCALVGFDVLEWNGTDRKGDAIANGVYLYKLDIEDAEGRHHTTIDRLVVHR